MVITKIQTLARFSDEELMDYIKSKNSQALREMYDRYNISLFNFLIRYTSNKEIAQDILQETFTNVWFAADTFNAGKGSFKSWIFKIGLNNARNEMTKKRYSYNYIDTDEIEGTGDELVSEKFNQPDFKIENEDAKEKLLLILNKLKPYLREVILLKHYQQFKFREISEITDTSAGTLKARFHKAIKELNYHLHKMELKDV